MKNNSVMLLLKLSVFLLVTNSYALICPSPETLTAFALTKPDECILKDQGINWKVGHCRAEPGQFEEVTGKVVDRNKSMKTITSLRCNYQHQLVELEPELKEVTTRDQWETVASPQWTKAICANDRVACDFK